MENSMTRIIEDGVDPVVERRAADASRSKSPPIKRRRIKKKKEEPPPKKVWQGKRKKGRLAFILETPTEIVFEILSHLTPVDILNLSYVDKELRALLTSDSAKSIWAGARENLPGLPDCPPDFTEWGYARFVFVKSCDVCGRLAHGLDCMPHLRVRLCSKCKASKCMNGMHFGSVSSLVPRYVDPNGYNALGFEAAISSEIGKVQRLSASEEAAYRVEREEFIRNVAEHARKLATFLEEVTRARNVEVRLMKKLRAEQIRTRLLALGHDARDIDRLQARKHRAVNQTVPLTERTWANVLPNITQALENIKTERLDSDRRARTKAALYGEYQKMWEALESDVDKYTYIPRTDFINLASVQKILDDNPSEERVTEVISAKMPDITEEIENFRRGMRRDLVWIMDSAESTAARLPSWSMYDDDMLVMPNTPEADRARRRMLSRATSLFAPIRGNGTQGQPVHHNTLLKYPLQTATMTLGSLPELVHHWDFYRRSLKFDLKSHYAMLSILETADVARDTGMDEIEIMSQNHERPFQTFTWQEQIEDDPAGSDNDESEGGLDFMLIGMLPPEVDEDDSDAVSVISDDDDDPPDA